MIKQFYFKQFHLVWVHSRNIEQFYWPIDRTLSGATTPGLSGHGSYDIEGVFDILQSSSITGLFSVISGHSLREFYLFAEMQSVYSAVPADWARELMVEWDV